MSSKFEYLDMAFIDNSNCDYMEANPAAPISDHHYEPFNAPNRNDDTISDLLSPLTYQPEQLGFNHEWMNEIYSLIAPDNDGTEHADTVNRTPMTSGFNVEPEHFSPTRDGDLQQGLVGMSKYPEILSKKRRRRQYHSCDPCRLAKRGCDLPIDISIHDKRPARSCSTCKIRGRVCTVAWLASRPDHQHAKKRGRTASHPSDTDNFVDTESKNDDGHQLDTPALEEMSPVLAPETEMAQQVVARETCLQQFRLYVDVWDMPMTACISHPCIPPSSPADVAGLAHLGNSSSFSMYFGKAQSWIASCWQMDSTSWEPSSAAPHLFFAVSILDSLFDPRSSQPGSASTSARDASISETYTWVARAMAAQFVIKKDGYDKTSPIARDMAITTWRKAKQLVFENIATTSSFRLALSLLLLGTTLPPARDKENCTEEVDYCLCEGIQRVQRLCAHARAYFPEHSLPMCRMGRRRSDGNSHPILKLPAGDRKKVLELIGALEWLANIVNWVTISISRGQTCASALDTDGDNVITIGPTTINTQKQTTEDVAAPSSQHGQGFNDIVATQAKKEPQSVMVMWSRGAEEHHLTLALSQEATPVVIHLYKSLAALTLAVQNLQDGEVDYDEIRQQCTIMGTLADLWRLAFGTVSETAGLSFQHLGSTLRRRILFCSYDGDLAVLLFYEIFARLQADLALQPSTADKERLYDTIQSMSARCKEHRLASSMQVAFLASISQTISSPGFQGKRGLKASIRDIAAHPVSTHHGFPCDFYLQNG
ncbi:GAL4 [Aspergillus sclerotialis]|uniref:GAL4 n=1 Tax=Aspergillus sclerotialis TaxID=2070753 RepID=A0A3A2ZX40_9EURO|nr:GAL4 [Aspergillus sclerotialis]